MGTGLGTSLSSDQCQAPVPLGLEDGTVQNNQMTSSRTYGRGYTAPNARLNGPRAWFCPDCDASDWIQVDLLTCTIINGVIMQGREDGQWDEYVSKYSVEYRMSTTYPFVYITEADGKNVVR